MSADSMLQLVDDLTDEITKARAIEAAIAGLRSDPSNYDKCEGVANFQFEHVERLVEIKDRLNALRTATAEG
jgi:hypothetical protein